MGLVAAGTASLHAAAPDSDLNSMQSSKIWSVSAALRGFYDDNYTTSPNGNKQGSGGFEVSPSLQLSIPLQQTEFTLKYTYGLYYYQERQNQGNDPVDQTHQVDFFVDHAFTERWDTTVHDTFAIGQEPTLLNPGGGPTAQPYRIGGNNLANNATVALTTDWTRLFSTVLTYNNGYFDYENSGGNMFNPSQAGLLNRIEQSVGPDLRWKVARDTYALIGYQFQWVDFTGNEAIAPNPRTLGPYYSDSRNNYSHIGYVGFQSMVLPNLNVSAKAGVQYTEYNNDPDSPAYTTPYVVSSASYTYMPGSYAQIGFVHEQNTTSIIAPSANGNITQNQQSSVVSASVNHKITAKLTGSIIGNVQFSRFNQGAYNNDDETIYSAGVNLSYAFNQHFSTDVGYNFDDLQSNIPQNGYSRNRVYLGVTAAY